MKLSRLPLLIVADWRPSIGNNGSSIRYCTAVAAAERPAAFVLFQRIAPNLSRHTNVNSALGSLCAAG